MVDYSVEEDQYGRIIKDRWELMHANLSILLGGGMQVCVGRSVWPLVKKKGTLSNY
jgi:hypothetical protein